MAPYNLSQGQQKWDSGGTDFVANPWMTPDLVCSECYYYCRDAMVPEYRSKRWVGLQDET